MALCHFAVHELLPENNTQNRIVPTTVICHRAVSSAKDLYGYWNSPGVALESHFYISEDGTIYQYMDTTIRADANVDANAFAVSIETWDGGNTPDSQGWNAIQVLRLKQLIKWICDTHGIKKGPALTWNGGGIGGHNWFPYPWADGPRGCPGTARNAQLRNDIIPAVASGNIEDDMNEEQNRSLGQTEAYARELWEVLVKGTYVPNPDQAKFNKDMAFVMDTLADKIDELDERIETGDINYDLLAEKVVARILSGLDVDLVSRVGS